MIISNRSLLLLQTIKTYKTLPIEFVNSNGAWYQMREIEELTDRGFIIFETEKGITCTDTGLEFLAKSIVPPTPKEMDVTEQFLTRFEEIDKTAKWTITRYQKHEISRPLLAAKFAAITEELDEIINGDRYSSIADRFNGFIDRFANSTKNIRLGDEGFIASPLKASFHSTLFEFHKFILENANQTRDARE